MVRTLQISLGLRPEELKLWEVAEVTKWIQDQAKAPHEPFRMVWIVAFSRTWNHVPLNG